MKHCKTDKIRREVESLLRATGKPWRIEEGTRHRKVFINEQFVGVFSRTKEHRKDTDQIAKLIRKACAT